MFGDDTPGIALTRALVDGDVEFIVVGGLALEIHGSSYVTRDADFLYKRSRSNCERIVAALAAHKPHFRVQGEPSGLAMVWDTPTLWNGGNFTLETASGYPFDLLARIAPNWRYEDVRQRGLVEIIEAGGLRFQMLSLQGLRETKSAANRPKDRAGLREIETMIEAEDMRRRLSGENESG